MTVKKKNDTIIMNVLKMGVANLKHIKGLQRHIYIYITFLIIFIF